MIESLIYAKMPPHLKKSINHAYLENGTYEQIVRHLEREMELNGLEADEPLVKTQMTVVKQQTNTQNTKSQPQKTKTKTKTPNTVPNNTLQNNQCRYCKEEGHIAKECPKLAKRQKLDNDPDAPIVTPQVMKNPIVTLEPTWKIAHPSGHSQKLNKNSLMSTKNQTNPSTPET